MGKVVVVVVDVVVVVSFIDVVESGVDADSRGEISFSFKG